MLSAYVSRSLPRRITSSSQARSRSVISCAPIHQTSGWNQKTVWTDEVEQGGKVVAAAEDGRARGRARPAAARRSAARRCARPEQHRASDAEDTGFEERVRASKQRQRCPCRVRAHAACRLRARRHRHGLAAILRIRIHCTDARRRKTAAPAAHTQKGRWEPAHDRGSAVARGLGVRTPRLPA